MRLMNWNIEHMNSWWEGGTADPPIMRNTFAGNNFSPAISDVPGLATRVGAVIDAVDPDVLTIQEGPGLPEINDFLNRFVTSGGWQVLRGSGGGQALIVAARIGGDIQSLTEGSTTAGTVDLNSPFRADVDANLEIDDVFFARQPQVVTLRAHNRDIMLINNHLKSKFVSNGEGMFNAGGAQRQQFFAGALRARRRISGEAYRIRAYLDEVLSTDPDARIIVTGDLNDGAGSDFFEENFLTHSVVDRIFGSVFFPDRQLKHALFHGGSSDFTAQFFDFIVGEVKDLVLDHIGISRELDQNWTWTGRVAVAEYTGQIDNNPALHERDRLPSDHRPVVVDMSPN